MERDWADRINRARKTIYALAIQTPLTRIVDQRFGDAQVYLKREDLQNSGSFKLRGAANKILNLPDQLATRGVVTSSTGNHALGVAAACRHRGINAEVFVSEQVSDKKVAMIQKYGARIVKKGSNPLEAELAARKESNEAGRTYVSPYNDEDVIAGQGTIAAELLAQLPEIDMVYVTVGGGGLISGIGCYLKAVSPKTEVIGCWPSNSRVMYECLRAGEIRDFAEEPTVSESSAGGVEPGSITFELCRKVVRRSILVPENEILDAMRWAHAQQWMLEGTAGVALAAAMRDSGNLQGKAAVVIACGRNTSSEVLARL